jgi:hypothetical protein
VAYTVDNGLATVVQLASFLGSACNGSKGLLMPISGVQWRWYLPDIVVYFNRSENWQNMRSIALGIASVLDEN